MTSLDGSFDVNGCWTTVLELGKGSRIELFKLQGQARFLSQEQMSTE